MQSVTRAQMAQIDEQVPREYGITIDRMLENAGYQIAEFLRTELDPAGITVYAGYGNNGGDALAAARRLHLWGYPVEVVLADRDPDGIRDAELQILERLNVAITTESARADHPVALDGLIGYNLEGDPRPPIDAMIGEVNSHETVVSIDLPTGVDPDTGALASPVVRPDYTVTLAMPKAGMDQQNSGRIWVADISIPPDAYERFGLDGDLFEEASLIELGSTE